MKKESGRIKKCVQFLKIIVSNFKKAKQEESSKDSETFI